MLQPARTPRCLRPALFLAVFLLAALASAGHAAAQDWAGAAYIITGLDGKALVLTEDDSMPSLQSGLLHAEASFDGGYELYLEPDQYAVIRHCGQVIQTRSQAGESISQFLSRHDVYPSPLEAVRVDLSGERTEVTVASDLVYQERVQETSPHNTIRRPNSKLAQGTERVVQEGSDGVRGAVYEVLWSNGQTASRQLIRELNSTAVDRIVEYGTAVKSEQGASSGAYSVKKVDSGTDGSGVLTLDSGETLRFTSVRTMTATAYTSGHDGVGTRTASGTAVHRGTVAVDRSVIPLGTRMYIVTKKGYVYGLSTAEDTGVRGNKIDLYFDTYQQCINFGRQECLVYILE